MKVTEVALKKILGTVPKGIARADAEDFFSNEIKMFEAGVRFILDSSKSMVVKDDTTCQDVDSFIHKNVSGESIILIIHE